ncbi:hypothetical protein OHD62_33200 [Mesorhizobium sp. YC-39]|uniref:hypothetical protein n=1 Tax=Mesorhizobium sp. YC-39 TaxID=2986065 RepID=UPI0021E8DB3E|nr:hypothetical protein [Mesorhizobium sp. YC-39]MCV3233227.1 hypothetical protein [Mesorhizobium sp. YC-39]
MYNAGPYNAQGGVPRYQRSPREFHETVEPFEYAKGGLLRRVQQYGFVRILGRIMQLCRAFAGKSVAVTRHGLGSSGALVFSGTWKTQ